MEEAVPCNAAENLMAWHIRTETEADYKNVEDVVRQAFAGVEHSDQSEGELVARLRKSNAFVSALSLVADINDVIVGHILFTKIEIVGNDGKTHSSLALAPVSVLPSLQRQGLGSALIEEGHARAKALGFTSVILLGHPSYYPRFGYKKASDWAITPPFDVPDDCFMAIELVDGALDGTQGRVRYPPEFKIA